MSLLPKLILTALALTTSLSASAEEVGCATTAWKHVGL